MNRNTDLAIGPAFEIGDRKTFKEWVGPDNLLSHWYGLLRRRHRHPPMLQDRDSSAATSKVCKKSVPGVKGSPASSESICS